jgi:phosphate uptake regulator/aminoglycoside phosphotransferase (APT) family kinase protein
MRISKINRENLRFLTAEVISQVTNLQEYFVSPSATLSQRILDRRGYAHNLKMRIHNSCLKLMAKRKESNVDTASLRALESIASELEQITDYCRDCILQMRQVCEKGCFTTRDFGPSLHSIIKGIERIEPAISKSDTKLALKIGQTKPELDKTYNNILKKYTAKLRRKKRTEAFVSVLLVAHDVQQMGDALLNISQAIISANLGQSVNIDRYHSLRASIEQLESDEDISNVVVEKVAETRSGSAISAISKAEKHKNSQMAIFKDGIKSKLKGEREGLKSWHEIYPGLAPRVLSYHKRGQSAALLIEHLAGLTFEQILLHEPRPLLNETLGELSKTLMSVWKETRTKKPVCAQYMAQLSKRLEDVYTIHPEFRGMKVRIGDHEVPAFDTVLNRAKLLESNLSAPFSVYIHGDFNVDNIIYDPVEKKINFIDLHRSRYMDYVQDVSVFMVSMYRLQVLDAPLRRRILEMVEDFYDVTAAFARRSRDKTFELRLALGLARSFATSTRFILDKTLARAMFLRARYLMERVLASDPGNPKNFQLPIEEIFIG